MEEAAAPERQMKRSLSALDLTALGIGAIIGAGIFALTGTAAAGQVFDLGHLGYVVVGLFAATWLCSITLWKTRRVEERWSAHLTRV